MTVRSRSRPRNRSRASTQEGQSESSTETTAAAEERASELTSDVRYRPAASTWPNAAPPFAVKARAASIADRPGDRRDEEQQQRQRQQGASPGRTERGAASHKVSILDFGFQILD